MVAVQISRAWAMPSADTFSIRPIKDLIARYELGCCVIDCFARNTTIGTLRNDLAAGTDATYHFDAETFADILVCWGTVATAILFDPPYSIRQCAEVYKSVGREFLQDDSQQAGRWTRLKDKLTQLCAPNSLAFSFGWNTTGFGKKRGWTLRECLIVNHGSAHNDTLCVVEQFGVV